MNPAPSLHLLWRNWSSRIGISLVLALVLVAIFAEQLSPYSAEEGDLAAARQPPAWIQGGSTDHLLGTDQLGQDIFSRILYGARVSVFVGLFGVLLATTIGIALGILAGYLGGWVDTVISAGVNLLLSLPYLVLVLVVATVFGRNLLNVILIFGITDAPLFIRLVRGEVLRIKQTDYLLAAHSLGAGSEHILLRHVFPNLIGLVITLATFEMSAMIFYEAGLSFLGLSVPPSVPSWGNMLSLGRRFLPILPWISIFPGLAIALLSLGINLLGGGLQKVFDPKQR